MASYHIWHPSYLRSAPQTLDAFITLGDAFFLARGTDEFVAAALAALGIAARPTAWSFQAMRCPYFSSYRDSGAWEDSWALAFRLRVDLPGAPELPELPAWGYHDLDAVDRSYHLSGPPDDWPSWPVLVLADVPDETVRARTHAAVVEMFPGAEIADGVSFGDVDQVRCVLGDRDRAYFEAGAVDAEALLVALTASGASVHYEETLRLMRANSSG